MINRLSLLSLILCIALGIQAQTLKSFSTDNNEVYLDELEEYLLNTRREDCEIAIEAYLNNAKTGVLDGDLLEMNIKSLNIMLGRNFRAHPQVVRYVQFVNSYFESGLTGTDFARWSDIHDQFTADQKLGMSKEYLAFLDFSSDFLNDRIIYNGSSRFWITDADDFTLSYEEGEVKLSLKNMKLTSFNKTDTLHIEQTSGVYGQKSNLWSGSGGVIDWARAGLEPSSVFAKLGDQYRIKLSGHDFFIDTVSFTHTEFFDKSISGSLTNKLVTSTSDEISYPRFASFKNDLLLPDVAPHVDFKGQFNMTGSKIYGMGDDIREGAVVFKEPGTDKVLVRAWSDKFIFKKGENVSSTDARIGIYFGKDSIFHPRLNFTYDIPKQQVRFVRGEEGIKAARFNDSYHNIEFIVDMLTLDLNTSQIEMHMIQGMGTKASIIESNNYFHEADFRKIQGPVNYHPLVVLKKVSEKNSNEVPSELVAKAFNPNLRVDQVRGLLYDLTKEGYIIYDEKREMVKIKDKTVNAVLGYSKKIDYDIIKFGGVDDDVYGMIDLKSQDAYFNGIKEIPISDSSFVFFYPYDGTVDIKEDRDMYFDGQVLAGRSDMDGSEHYFDYEKFQLNLNRADSILLYIWDKEKKDPQGDPLEIPLRSKIEKVQGFLAIDVPINKSGRSYLSQFPKLRSEKEAYVYYDKKETFHSVYEREKFYFELEPFKLDSLRDFSRSAIDYPGKLVSAGIFPDLPENIKIQPDLSLGFVTTTAADGLPIYGGKGTYTDTIRLNNFGLRGKGDINYISSYFDSDNIIFFPEALTATSKDFRIEKTTTGGQYPPVESDHNDIFWKPYQDTMLVRMIDTPFTMYEGKTILKGDLTYTNLGLTGGGTLEWEEADLSSKLYRFKTTSLESDTANLKIKSLDGDKVTFNTPNVSVKVDFEKNLAQFKSNLKDIPTNFAYNQYTTTINEFNWDIDAKTLEFKAPEDGNGAYFTSTNPNQDSLKFKAMRAFFSLETAIMEIEEVEKIAVADVFVKPAEGKVVIEPQARMRRLEGATIIADSASGQHEIYDVSANILGKYAIRGKGKYDFKVPGMDDQVIELEEFEIETKTFEVKKDILERNYFTALAEIEEDDEFHLHGNVRFKGDLKLTAVDEHLRFTGHQRIDFKNDKMNTTWVGIDQKVDPAEIRLQIDTLETIDNRPAITGVYMSTTAPQPMYTAIMGDKYSVRDRAIFRAEGEVIYNPTKEEYTFADSIRRVNTVREGNLMVYNDNEGKVRTEGEIDLGLRLGAMRTIGAGFIDNDINQGTYKMDMSFGLDMAFDRALNDLIGFYLFEDNFDKPDILYDNEKYKKMLEEMVVDEKDERKALESIESSGFFPRPKDLFPNFMFTNVNFTFDQNEMALKAKGPFGLQFVGEKEVHKTINGFMRFGYRSSSDYFEILLKTSTNDWIYFAYRSRILLVVSSYGDVNDAIKMTPPDKRKVRGEGNEYYQYKLTTPSRAEYFEELMTGKISAEEYYGDMDEEETDSTAVDSLALDSINRANGSGIDEEEEAVGSGDEEKAAPGDGSADDAKNEEGDGSTQDEEETEDFGDGLTPMNDKKSKKSKKDE